MRRLLIVVLGVLGVVLFAVPVGACTPCIPLTEQEKLQRADLVVVGVVSDRDTIFSELATVQVEETVKGEAVDTVPVGDPGDHPCLSPLTEGHRYRLFLVRSSDAWARLACAAAEPLTDEPVLPWWRIHNEQLAAAAAVLVASGLALAVVRMRRRRHTA
ncbi:hypothetical protein [Catellatospora sichuanensis]|uniref:hypothetical protein n=1 Tax=Catellatospora sichuanensis TaxID=1969805 RepID=UPI00118382CB|nr:hypothetical protein [Catellatospora sichuanensis]